MARRVWSGDLFLSCGEEDEATVAGGGRESETCQGNGVSFNSV